MRSAPTLPPFAAIVVAAGQGLRGEIGVQRPGGRFRQCKGMDIRLEVGGVKPLQQGGEQKDGAG